MLKSFSTKENPGRLIIDFTIIPKMFVMSMAGTTYDYDGSKKCVTKGYSVGVAAWTNGVLTIPLTFSFWLRKKDALNAYLKKSVIAKELINYLKKVIPFDEVLLDGAFASIGMFQFLLKAGINFTLRIPRNRKIITADGKEAQLQHHPALQLIKNEKFKTVKASIKGFKLFFTAHKRKGKNDTKEVVFIVSNLCKTPKTTIDSYATRNNTEKFFRTGKQSLGLNDCQSTNINKQRMLIFSTMYAYACLEIVKVHKKKKNPEAIINVLRRQKSTNSFHEYIDLIKTIGLA